MRIFEFDPSTDWIMYHGSQNDFDSFGQGMVYMTNDEEEAWDFAQNVHRPGQAAEASIVYTIAARPGKVLDINDELSERMMDDEDVDDIINEKAVFARQNGYRYLTFYHPSVRGDEFEAMISLFPNKDLEIVDKTQ